MRKTIFLTQKKFIQKKFKYDSAVNIHEKNLMHWEK